MFLSASFRLRALSAQIDIRWRYKVARPLIENCLAVEMACPREWGSLSTTENPVVRHCDTCRRQVIYCSTVEQAGYHARAGRCVAVDIAQIRRRGDLEPPRVRMMGAMVPPTGG